MRHAVVRITDKKGTWFRMKIATTTAKGRLAAGVGGKVSKWVLMDTTIGRDLVTKVLAGEWKTVDKGFIQYGSGETRSRLSSNGDMTTRDLLILGPGGVKTHDAGDEFGMQLFQYEDLLSVNDEGEGSVYQPWVLTLTPGRIFWKVIDRH